MLHHSEKIALAITTALAAFELPGTPGCQSQHVGWIARPAAGPPGRAEFGLAYDSTRGVTVLFGGHHGGDNRYGDTWEWDGVSWTQRAGTNGSFRRVVGQRLPD